MNRTSAVALCLALLSLPAMAQPQGDPPPRPDGARHPGGEQGELTQLFVSPCGKPFRAGPTASYPVAAWFADADANHDGALDQAEFRADSDAFFQTLDVNHDGVLSSFEVSRYEHVVVPEILAGRDMSQLDGRPRIILAQVGGMGGMDGGMGGMGGGGMGGIGGGGLGGGDDGQPSHHGGPVTPSMEGAAPFNLLREPEPVASSDLDLDSRITRAEFRSAADRRFRRLDVKASGKLTAASLPMTLQQKMLAGGRRGPPRAS